MRAVRALEIVNTAGFASPAIVTHEMIGRTLLAALVGLSHVDALATELPHGCVVEVRPGSAEFAVHHASGEQTSRI